jgi:hypothetical protein
MFGEYQVTGLGPEDTVLSLKLKIMELTSVR